MKKIIFLFTLLGLFAADIAAQPAIRNGSLFKVSNGDSTFLATALQFKTWMAAGGGTVTTVSGGTTGLTYTNPTTTPTMTGTLIAANGGTGQSSYTTGDLLQATAATTLTPLAAVATGNALISGGVGTASSWGKIGLATHVSGTLPVANGGTGLASLGSDVTLLGSNGTANIYYALGITNTSAAIAFARSSSTLNLNIPDADASFRGTVSTGTQTFAGAKTFSGALTGSSTGTFSGLLTGSAGVIGTASASVAALNAAGVSDADYIAPITTGTVTLDQTHNYLPIGTLVAAATINLPACNSTRDGWEYRIERQPSADTFAATIDPNSTETFSDAATTKVLYAGASILCKCRSSNNTWLFSTH